MLMHRPETYDRKIKIAASRLRKMLEFGKFKPNPNYIYDEKNKDPRKQIPNELFETIATFAIEFDRLRCPITQQYLPTQCVIYYALNSNFNVELLIYHPDARRQHALVDVNTGKKWVHDEKNITTFPIRPMALTFIRKIAEALKINTHLPPEEKSTASNDSKESVSIAISADDSIKPIDEQIIDFSYGESAKAKELSKSIKIQDTATKIQLIRMIQQAQRKGIAAFDSKSDDRSFEPLEKAFNQKIISAILDILNHVENKGKYNIIEELKYQLAATSSLEKSLLNVFAKDDSPIALAQTTRVPSPWLLHLANGLDIITLFYQLFMFTSNPFFRLIYGLTAYTHIYHRHQIRDALYRKPYGNDAQKTFLFLLNLIPIIGYNAFILKWKLNITDNPTQDIITYILMTYLTLLEGYTRYSLIQMILHFDMLKPVKNIRDALWLSMDFAAVAFSYCLMMPKLAIKQGILIFLAALNTVLPSLSVIHQPIPRDLIAHNKNTLFASPKPTPPRDIKKLLLTSSVIVFAMLQTFAITENYIAALLAGISMFHLMPLPEIIERTTSHIRLGAAKQA